LPERGSTRHFSHLPENARKWGWGIHYNKDREIALVGCETEEYERLARSAQDRKTAVRALRNTK
jgi:hypothetical protein